MPFTPSCKSTWKAYVNRSLSFPYGMFMKLAWISGFPPALMPISSGYIRFPLDVHPFRVVFQGSPALATPMASQSHAGHSAPASTSPSGSRNVADAIILGGFIPILRVFMCFWVSFGGFPHQNSRKLSGTEQNAEPPDRSSTSCPASRPQSSILTTNAAPWLVHAVLVDRWPILLWISLIFDAVGGAMTIE